MDNRIKNIRKYYNLSQKEFGELFNVDQTAVSNWEKGKNGVDIELAKKIAAKYNLPLEYIYGENYELALPMDRWRDSYLEDYYNERDNDARDVILYKHGRGFFRKHEDLFEDINERTDIQVAFTEGIEGLTENDKEIVFNLIKRLKEEKK